MIKEFENLSDAESDLMLKAPFLVCILIAGADGTIDNKEIREAISVVQKSTKSMSVMAEFFKELIQDFEDKLRVLIQSYPNDPSARSAAIANELGGLNSIWPKLSAGFSTTYYSILLHMAERIASSSGGLLGIRSVGSEEARLVTLDMIKPPSA